MVLNIVVVLSVVGFPVLMSGAPTPGTKLWQMGSSDFGQPASAPALAPDGTIYFAAALSGASRSSLYALTPEGQPLWGWTPNRVYQSTFCIASDGTVYFGTEPGELWSLSPSGQTNWMFKSGLLYSSFPASSPAVAADGTVYFKAFNGSDQRLYSLNPLGQTNWTVALAKTRDNPGMQISSPVIGPDGSIYVTSAATNLHCVSPEGFTNWVRNIGRLSYSSPAIAEDGSIYLGDDAGYISSYDAAGNLRWRYLSPGFVESSPAIASDGSIYVGYYRPGTGGLLALDKNGGKLWSWDKGNGVSSSPVLDQDGNIYFTEFTSGYLRVLNSSGSNIWSFPIGTAACGCSPVISPEGVVYVANGTKLFAIWGGKAPMRGAWPGFRGSAQHSARATQRGLRISPLKQDQTVDLSLTLEVGKAYSLRSSTNLSQWSDFLTLTATNWKMVVNVQATNAPGQFFRLATTLD
jgi:streptogramin lyase